MPLIQSNTVTEVCVTHRKSSPFYWAICHSVSNLLTCNIRMQSSLSVDNLFSCKVTDLSCDGNIMSQEFCGMWKVKSSLIIFLLASILLVSLCFLLALMSLQWHERGLLKQHTFKYMDAKEWVTPVFFLCAGAVYWRERL